MISRIRMNSPEKNEGEKKPSLGERIKLQQRCRVNAVWASAQWGDETALGLALNRPALFKPTHRVSSILRQQSVSAKVASRTG